MKLLFFDLETTGTNPARHGIHQISGIVEVDGVEQERFDFKVRPNPKAEVLDEALAVGGVTREQIEAYPAMEEVYGKLVALLARYVNKFDKNDKFFLVGYNNASFDNQFLRGFFMQNGDNYFGSWFWSNSLDVMVLASQYLLAERQLMPNFKLSTVASHLGIKIDDGKLHDAYYDIHLTREVYREITIRY
jgi:exonuclease|nr:MAG TPA: DNA polymerase III subunit alpha [Caudoviricetes sp.]